MDEGAAWCADGEPVTLGHVLNRRFSMSPNLPEKISDGRKELTHTRTRK